MNRKMTLKDKIKSLRYGISALEERGLTRSASNVRLIADFIEGTPSDWVGSPSDHLSASIFQCIDAAKRHEEIWAQEKLGDGSITKEDNPELFQILEDKKIHHGTYLRGFPDGVEVADLEKASADLPEGGNSIQDVGRFPDALRWGYEDAVRAGAKFNGTHS